MTVDCKHCTKEYVQYVYARVGWPTAATAPENTLALAVCANCSLHGDGQVVGGVNWFDSGSCGRDYCPDYERKESNGHKVRKARKARQMA